MNPGNWHHLTRSASRAGHRAEPCPQSAPPCHAGAPVFDLSAAARSRHLALRTRRLRTHYQSWYVHQYLDSLQGMARVALVTGATQGLGLALVESLAARLESEDTVYLTGRHP